MASRSTFEVRLGLLAGGAAALLLTFGSAPAWAQAVLYTVAGTSVDDLFGYAAVGVGDTDLDGVPDLLVGAPQITPAGAEGYLIVLGGPAGAPRFLLSGGVPEGEFGRAVTGLGDVTGDGAADFAVGAPAQGNGRVYLISGAAAGAILTVDGDDPGDLYGFSVAGMGDLDGDAVGDLAVGIPGDDTPATDAGALRAVSVATGATIFTIQGLIPADHFGNAVANVGDVDGDLLNDIAVGADNASPAGSQSGQVRVLSGANGATLYTFDGQSGGDHFGAVVAGAGDVNNDGTPDVIVGAPFDDDGGNDAGSATVFSGADGSILYKFDGDAAGHELGYSVAGIGDVNIDGFDDVAAGAPLAFGVTGYVRIYSGADGAPFLTLNGDIAGDLFGTSVNPAGDVDGDAYPDVAVGAIRPGQAGYVRVYSGLDIGPCPDADLDGYGNPVNIHCAMSAIDCAPADPAINPGAAEICANGIDDDCDMDVDGADTECGGAGCAAMRSSGHPAAALLYLGAALGFVVVGRGARRRRPA
ncbi:MAG: FG-GAP repeat protein [Myxococcales bacterium]|nr:FG-GAP repeat protein [Myxococcales bacterium]